MKSCEEISAMLDAVIDGTATEQESSLVMEHISTCGECRALYELLSGIESALTDSVEPPEELTDNVMAAVREIGPHNVKSKAMTNRRRYTVRYVAVAACVLLVCAAAFRLLPRLGGAGSDNASMSAADMNGAAPPPMMQDAATAGGGAGNDDYDAAVGGTSSAPEVGFDNYGADNGGIEDGDFPAEDGTQESAKSEEPQSPGADASDDAPVGGTSGSEPDELYYALEETYDVIVYVYHERGRELAEGLALEERDGRMVAEITPLRAAALEELGCETYNIRTPAKTAVLVWLP